MITSYQLSRQFVNLGDSRKIAILAARYYNGLETTETLRRYLTAAEVAQIRANT